MQESISGLQADGGNARMYRISSRHRSRLRVLAARAAENEFACVYGIAFHVLMEKVFWSEKHSLSFPTL